MAKKKLIWIIGATASGKSTLRRSIVDLIAKKDGEIISVPDMEYTDYGNVAVLGKCRKDGVCDGLDISFNHMRKEGCMHTVEECIKNHDYTFIEGTMATGQWILPLCEFCFKYDCKFYLIHIDLRYWENYKRLVKRVIERGGTEKDIEDSMLDSVRGKSVQMRNLFNKCKGLGFIKTLQINTEDMSNEDKMLRVINFLKLKI